MCGIKNNMNSCDFNDITDENQKIASIEIEIVDGDVNPKLIIGKMGASLNNLIELSCNLLNQQLNRIYHIHDTWNRCSDNKTKALTKLEEALFWLNRE